MNIHFDMRGPGARSPWCGALLAGALLLAAAQAEATTVNNTTKNDVVVSDLTLYQNRDYTGKTQLVLVGGKTNDDVTVKAGKRAQIDLTYDGKALMSNYEAYRISFMQDGSENEYYRRGGPRNPVNLLTQFSAGGIALFMDNPDDLVFDDDLEFDVVNGFIAGYDSYFFSLTDFSFDANGERVGGDPFSGRVSTQGTLQLIHVPEPGSLGLALAALWALRRHGARLAPASP